MAVGAGRPPHLQAAWRYHGGRLALVPWLGRPVRPDSRQLCSGGVVAKAWPQIQAGCGGARALPPACKARPDGEVQSEPSGAQRHAAAALPASKHAPVCPTHSPNSATPSGSDASMRASTALASRPERSSRTRRCSSSVRCSSSGGPGAGAASLALSVATPAAILMRSAVQLPVRSGVQLTPLLAHLRQWFGQQLQEDMC